MLRSSFAAFRALIPVLRPQWRGMIASYCIGTVSALALAGLTVVTAWAVGHAVVDRTLPGVGWWLTVAILVLLRAVLTWKEMDVSHALAYRVLARLRMVLFDAYARSVPGKRREHSGRAASVAMDDIEKLEFFYAHTLAQIATSFTVVLASVLTATILLPGAGCVLVLGVVLIAASAVFAGKTIRDLGAAEQHERTELSTRIVDALGALREVLVYGLTSRIVNDTLEVTERTTAIARRRELLTQLVTAIREVTVAAVVIGVIGTSAYAAGGFSVTGQSGISPAVIPALVALALAGVSAASDASTTLTQLHPLVASASRVASGIARPAVVTAATETHTLPSGPLGLRFREVSFSYDSGHEGASPVLVSWSAEVRAGEHVGLAGPSGSGKSTLITLAARLWDPDAGSIEVFGQDGQAVPLRQLEDSALRAAVAVVDQEATLFHGTVRENLLRGAPARPDHELWQVLDRVGAAEWIDLDLNLGQGGLRLSGGQQARLCLARALVRKPRILLVDEVTASLDPDTERTISEVIASYDGTVIVASHRAETLDRLQRVIQL